MLKYVATFHTHLGALLTYRTLLKQKITAKMAPVPRKLSASCGTCVFYEAKEPCLEAMSEEFEAIYEIENLNYKLIHEN